SPASPAAFAGSSASTGSPPYNAIAAMDGLPYQVVEGSPAAIQLAQFQLQNGPTAESAYGARAAVVPPPLAGSRYESASSGGSAAPPAPVVAASQAPVPVPTEIASTSVPQSVSPPRVRFPGRHTVTEGPLAELELMLSQMVIQPPSSWRLGPIREEAAAMLASSDDAAMRTGLRDLIDRIATFEQVQTRYTTPLAQLTQQTPAQPPQAPEAGSLDPFDAVGARPGIESLSAASDRPTADAVANRIREDLQGASAAAQRLAAAPTGPAATRMKYDAVGTLKPVVSKRPGAPRYALVDDAGAVVSFLTPTNNLDLQAFLGKRIGVTGERGYISEYRQAHVVAGRVTPLDATLRR
ncbi:MAG: hypothetical protein KDA61_02290, partial [Planctomycetales bacterium]|nr:hypothetical protein [Planctomycetales bacterium]